MQFTEAVARLIKRFFHEESSPDHAVTMLALADEPLAGQTRNELRNQNPAFRFTELETSRDWHTARDVVDALRAASEDAHVVFLLWTADCPPHTARAINVARDYLRELLPSVVIVWWASPQVYKNRVAEDAFDSVTCLWTIVDAQDHLAE